MTAATAAIATITITTIQNVTGSRPRIWLLTGPAGAAAIPTGVAASPPAASLAVNV